MMHRRGYYEIFRGGTSIAHGEQHQTGTRKEAGFARSWTVIHVRAVLWCRSAVVPWFIAVENHLQ